MNGPLSAEEITSFHSNGYVVPNFRLSREEVSELRRLAASLIADNPEQADQALPMPHVAGDGTDGKPRSSGEIAKYTTHPRLLDLIEQLIGPDLILWTTTLFHKSPKSGPATPWHQDTRYWPMRPLTNANFWIAITESTLENACMRVIPGTHRSFIPHLKTEGKAQFALTLDQAAFDEADAVDIVLEPGEMLIFDGGIVHGSHPNNGTRERIGFAARYIPGSSNFDHDFEYQGKVGYADRPLELVRGVNRGNNDLARNHPS
jgi:hypothetical protein